MPPTSSTVRLRHIDCSVLAAHPNGTAHTFTCQIRRVQRYRCRNGGGNNSSAIAFMVNGQGTAAITRDVEQFATLDSCGLLLGGWCGGCQRFKALGDPFAITKINR